ncbi:integrase family protein [Yersinia enterocolitica]|nr:integrase family protein [Yersinia enterocolitica]
MLSTENKMAISDTKLRSLYGKSYSGASEVTDLDGLGIRVSPNGVITFQYRFRWEGKQHRIGIGRYPAVTLKDARNKVADFRENLARGLDPRLLISQNKNTKKPTVKDCLTYWEDTYVSVSLRDKTKELYKYTVIKHMSNAFPGVPVDAITVRDWMDLFTEEEKINQRRARHLLVQLRSAINWCIRRQYIDDCSLMKISPRDIGEKPAVGDKVLTYNEMARIWLAIEQ